MKKLYGILLLCFALRLTPVVAQEHIALNFFDTTVLLPKPPAAPRLEALSAPSVQRYVDRLSDSALAPYLQALLQYRAQYRPDDWLYYQLVRQVAQQLSPKTADYNRYTVYKWWLLAQSGYDTRLTLAGNYLLFYVQSNENVYNIPSRSQEGKQYVCLNYHDYGVIDFEKYRFEEITLPLLSEARAFSYVINRLPQFSPTDYKEQQVGFEDRHNFYRFRIKLNPHIKALFTNYPVVDYHLQFNMPLSEITYGSLLPALRKEIAGLKTREGVDFLMRFTRYAFLFKPDGEVFGSEKRLSPEQTLLSEYSDCEDRAALFFYLVKELYNLPMLVLAYPQHVTVAVQFDKAFGNTIDYEGQRYTICEPSPQRYDLGIGQLPSELKRQAYEVAYAYHPDRK